MGDLTPTQITAISTAVCAVIAAMFSDRVMRAITLWRNWRKEERESRMAQIALDRELDETGHKAIIRRQDRHIRAVEQTCEDLRKDHAECREELAGLKMRISRVEDHTHTPKGEGEG